MKTYKPLILTISLLLSLPMAALKAEEVEVFDQPPSAEEMGEILFGNKSETTEPTKMRSIGFIKKPSNASKSDDLIKSAKADLRSIGLPIKFASNSDTILAESIPFVEEIGKMMTLDEYADKRLIIEGHTDSAGSDSANMALSKRRANAVGQYLSKNFGISNNRLQPLGLGETRPLPGHKPEDIANRRVQLFSAN